MERLREGGTIEEKKEERGKVIEKRDLFFTRTGKEIH